MAEKPWLGFPLLVHIQSIDSTSAELHPHAPRTGSTKYPSTNVQVTCLEGSNRFVFVGFSNGTTDVYFRTSFSYVTTIKIPSIEAKICNLLCSEDENFVAVSSIHGKLSILRCVHERLRTDGSLKASNDEKEGSLFKLLYSVTQHVGSEITSLFWSSNERNLFVGDSCGLVSQLTVEFLEQFPRPTPIKSVLEASSRVMQMDYMFPFLAIATVHSVYLCDIEGTEFVRVQLKRLRDIRATGVCFQLTLPHNAVQVTGGCLQLLISEEGSGLVHVANMEGVIVRSLQVSTFPSTTMCPAKLFDPVRVASGGASQGQDGLEAVDRAPSMSTPIPEHLILGSLLVFDATYIVSYTHEYIYVLEQSQVRIIAWIPFSKIQKVKMVSNYLFVWHSKTLSLISLTPFRHYGEQLLKAELINVLERWIDHTAFSVGWRPVNFGMDLQQAEVESSPSELHNQTASEIFQQMLGTPTSEHEAFCAFVYKYVPDGLIRIPSEYLYLKVPPPESPLASFLREKLIPTLESADLQLINEEASVYVNTTLEVIQEFYSVQNVRAFGDTALARTLVNVLESCEDYWAQVKMLLDNKRTTLQLLQRCKLLMNGFIEQFLHSRAEIQLTASNFHSFACLSSTSEWFTTVGVCHEETLRDAIRADLLVYLSPFSNSAALVSNWPDRLQFFSWLTFEVVLDVPIRSNSSISYQLANLIKSFANVGNADNVSKMTLVTKFRSQLISLAYREMLSTDLTNVAPIFHHWASLIHFITGGTIDESLRSVLACLPLQHWSGQEISRRIAGLCKDNEVVLNVLIQARLRDSSSRDLCLCSLPVSPVAAGLSTISSVQRHLDECILGLLLKARDPNIALEESRAYEFAMRRSLAEHLLVLQQHNLSEVMVAKIIEHSGSCSLLQRLSCTSGLLKLLVNQLTSGAGNKDVCAGCGCQITPVSEIDQLNFDCIGLWIVSQYGLDESISVIKQLGLNAAGTFSSRFYRSIGVIMSQRNQKNTTVVSGCYRHDHRK